jgi:hypothetical protein
MSQLGMSSPAAPTSTEADAGLPVRERRQRVLFSGKIMFDNGFTLDCTIRNLSEGGAQVRVAAGPLLPDDFYLIEIRSGAAYRAHVAWRSPGIAGLKFIERLDLQRPAPGVPADLRQLWLACAVRGAYHSEGQ